MKKLLPLMFVFAISSSLTYAQPGGGRGQNIETMKAMYKDSLQLSAVQVDSVGAILNEFMPKQREVFMNQDMSREDKMAAVQALNIERNKRLKAILTADQFTKLEAMEERRRQQRMQGGGRNGN